MNKQIKNLTGNVYGRLTVESFAYADGMSHWNCVCKCGRAKIISGHHLVTGNTRSCGCLNKEKIKERSTKHGQTGSKAYNSWYGMMSRCYNPNHKRFYRYGGRGIIVEERWHTASNFLDDMGPRPKRMTLERIDNDGNYGPSNCRWASYEEQTRNTRRNVWFTVNGKKMTQSELARYLGVAHSHIQYYTKKGLTGEEIVSYFRGKGSRLSLRG